MHMQTNNNNAYRSAPPWTSSCALACPAAEQPTGPCYRSTN